MIADEPWDRQNCAMCPEDIMFRVFRGNFAAKNMVSKDHTDEHNARASEPSNNINFVEDAHSYLLELARD